MTDAPLSPLPGQESPGPESPTALLGATEEIMLLDEQRRVCWVNPAKRRRLGGDLADYATGRQCQEVPDLCLHACDEACQALGAWGNGGDDSHTVTLWRTSRPTGCPVLVQLSTLVLAGGRRVVAVRHSPKEPRQERGQIGRPADRRSMWAAMSALTTGLSHELRNPLTALEMRLAALRARPAYGLNAAARQAVEEIGEVVRRIGEVVEGLCAFNPAETLAPLDVDPAGAIREVLHEQAEVLRGVRTEVIHRCRGLLHADPGRLRQALSALVENAAGAMGGHGRLTITLTCSGSWCLIDVADTGPGIPPEIQSRLGQPFVTTKPPGQGAGLGLSLCQLMVDRHGGHLRLMRTGPQGTTVRIALPGFECL